MLDHNTDVSRHHTYSWTPADGSSTGDPRLDGNLFFQDHLQGEVNRQMSARGFKGPRSGKADLLVHYHASLTERLNANLADSNYGYCYGSCRDGAMVYDAGTIVIDIVDAHTKKVIWRGWARESVESAIANPDKLARTIHDAVAAIMSDLPRSIWAPTST
jgi:hypothetical protein